MFLYELSSAGRFEVAGLALSSSYLMKLGLSTRYCEISSSSLDSAKLSERMFTFALRTPLFNLFGSIEEEFA